MRVLVQVEEYGIDRHGELPTDEQLQYLPRVVLFDNANSLTWCKTAVELVTGFSAKKASACVPLDQWDVQGDVYVDLNEEMCVAGR